MIEKLSEGGDWPSGEGLSCRVALAIKTTATGVEEILFGLCPSVPLTCLSPSPKHCQTKNPSAGKRTGNLGIRSFSDVRQQGEESSWWN